MIPKPHMAQGENRILQAVLWPPYIHVHTLSKQAEKTLSIKNEEIQAWGADLVLWSAQLCSSTSQPGTALHICNLGWRGTDSWVRAVSQLSETS